MGRPMGIGFGASPQRPQPLGSRSTEEPPYADTGRGHRVRAAVRDFQRLTLAALIDSGSVRQAFEAGLTEEHFPAYPDVWVFVEQYVRRNGKPPTRQIMEARYPQLELPMGQELEVRPLIERLLHDWLYERASRVMDEAGEILLQDNPVQALAFMQSQSRTLAARMVDGSTDVDLLADHDRWFQEAIGRAAAVQRGELRGIATGFRALDEKTGGLDDGELVTTVARQGEGKTWTLMYTATSAVLQGKKVCFVPLEMSQAQVAFRFHCLFQGRMDPGGHLRNSALTTGRGYDLKTYRDFLQRLHTDVPGKLILCDPVRQFSPATVLAKIQEHEPDMLVVDYLTLMSCSGGKAIEDWSSIRQLTQELKALAMDFKVPILIAAQANRTAVMRQGPPELQDIAFGDAIGMDSDRVISLKRCSKRVTQGRMIKDRHGEEIRRDFYLRTDYNRGRVDEVTEDKATELIQEDRDADRS